MNKFFSILIRLFLISNMAGCSKKAKQFNSIDELTQELIVYLNNGDAVAINEITMKKDEYINDFFPNIPESKSMSGKDKFEIFMKVKRANAIMVKAKAYKGNIVELVKVGKPEDIIKLKMYTVYKKIPLVIKVQTEDDAVPRDVVDNQILGVVVERDGKFQLLNMFK